MAQRMEQSQRFYGHIVKVGGRRMIVIEPMGKRPYELTVVPILTEVQITESFTHGITIPEDMFDALWEAGWRRLLDRVMRVFLVEGER